MKILIITILLCLTYFGWLKLYKDENFWGGGREAISDWLAAKNLNLLSELAGCPFCCAFWSNAILFCLPLALVSIHASVVAGVVTALVAYNLKKEEE